MDASILSILRLFQFFFCNNLRTTALITTILYTWIISMQTEILLKGDSRESYVLR